LPGALGQRLRRRKRLRHQGTGGFIAASNSRRFDGIERQSRHGGGLVGEQRLQPCLVVCEQLRSNVRIVWKFGLQSERSP
jgi:uncharacterized pyridoxal phosphate-containing UPF0001 family protein